tara:strand:- start:396 stop:911 length:516 start_codon:yes stop_codon:yes gene_type:complete
MNANTNTTSIELFAKLEEFGIKFSNHEHPPLRTVAESQSLRGELPGAHIKNLFLRDKKRRFFLVTVAENRDVDLKWLRRAIGAQGTLSFGSSESLNELLGVVPGAVTPLSVINDKASVVTAFIDKELLDADLVNAHPLRNDMTTALSAHDLISFMETVHRAPNILDFDANI